MCLYKYLKKNILNFFYLEEENVFNLDILINKIIRSETEFLISIELDKIYKPLKKKKIWNRNYCHYNDNNSSLSDPGEHINKLKFEEFKKYDKLGKITVNNVEIPKIKIPINNKNYI